MIYCKEKSSEISVPLGGIGAGCIGLTGNGRLSDWEIFNVSNKNSLLGYTHFCVSAAGKYRLLQGECFAPYTGKYRKATTTPTTDSDGAWKMNCWQDFHTSEITFSKGHFPQQKWNSAAKKRSFP